MNRERSFELDQVQAAIRAEGMAGWLFYDFQGLDPLAQRILGLDTERIRTRRWFYFVPSAGDPAKIVHRIEAGALDGLPGTKHLYASWQDLSSELARRLEGTGSVAMQYSPGNAIPYISKVDAGTVEMVRAAGVEVVSAADLVQRFEALLTPAELDTHLQAAATLRRIVEETFAHMGETHRSGRTIDEHGAMEFVLACFEREGLVTDELPICAVDAHAGDPHYEPPPSGSSEIREGSLVLLDIFAKGRPAGSIYADITWMGYVGEDVPERYVELFGIIRDARDLAVSFLAAELPRREVLGWEVDDVVRGHIAGHGFGEFFIHRTGHSIGTALHGNGVNIDNLETQDARRIVPGMVFSVEPGIYLDDCGFRTEIDVYVDEEGPKISGLPAQQEIVKILC